jgi:hypothetical protein
MHEDPLRGHVLDVTTVRELWSMAQETSSTAQLEVLDEHLQGHPADPDRLDALSDYELRRLRLVDPLLDLAADGPSYAGYTRGDLTARLLAHVEGAGRPRVHWRLVGAHWPVPATVALIGGWTWVAVDGRSPASVVVLLGLLGLLAVAGLGMQLRQGVLDAYERPPGNLVISSTREQVRRDREVRRRTLATGGTGLLVGVLAATVVALLVR